MSEVDAIDIRALTGIEGRVAIVTGAGQGIGRAFARALGAAGGIPVIAERNMERGQAVAKEIEQTGGRAIAVETDVADLASVQAMVERTVGELGRIDILINNAGIFSTLTMRPFEEIPLDEWDEVMRVNVTGVMLGCRAVLPHMRRAKWGRIINMSSGSVLLGRPNYLHYTTSKAALIGMTRSMARELGGDGITVNAIMPGAVKTEIPRRTVTPEQRARITAMQCIPRVQEPVDLVGAMLFLASEGSRFMTGQSINIDGGATHL
jgi:NAD(P)-dependent dehydrogenase (short-subunit alcohol dehydrogenase family)